MTPIIIANWKMNCTMNQARSMANACLSSALIIEAVSKGIEVVLCPPFTSISAVAEIVVNSNIGVGGQDCHWEKSGAYTGDISAEMLSASGCGYAIAGHSERRRYHMESDSIIGRKSLAAARSNLVPVICVGETEAERDSGLARQTVGGQLSAISTEFSESKPDRAYIAYEPIWAIGTGRIPSTAEISDMHKHIGLVLEKLGLPSYPIIYGGSVTAENAQSILAIPQVSGVLVGGASLSVESFSAIIYAGMNLLETR